MRELATIQKISSIEPIEGADAIVVASVLGWKVVIRKDEFAVGDLCVYCEIDSIMPDRPEFEFLRSRKFKVKTIRLRGQISQGICFPITILPFISEVGYREGFDVTKLLGITKYEPEEPKSNQKDKFVFPRWFPVFLRRYLVRNLPAVALVIIKLLPRTIEAKTWPNFFPKTDETRVQVLQGLLDEYAGQLFVMTEKLDGSSGSFYKNRGRFGVCSRKLDLKSKDNVWWRVAERYDLKKNLPDGYVFQGEVVGPKIQGNKYNLDAVDVYFYNVWDIKEQRYLSPGNAMGMILGVPGLKLVPQLGSITIGRSIGELVQTATQMSTINAGIPMEGIVFRPMEETTDPILAKKCPGNRVSFKVINPEFLLKYGL